jgi:hypothetical protein
MPQEMLNKLMLQFKQQNPDIVANVENMMKSGKTPQDLVQEMIGKCSPNQKQNILNQAKSMGVPESILGIVQSMK